MEGKNLVRQLKFNGFFTIIYAAFIYARWEIRICVDHIEGPVPRGKREYHET